MKVEYLLVRDDNTWDTTIVEVPLKTTDREKLIQWAEENLAAPGIVQFGLYLIAEDDDDG